MPGQISAPPPPAAGTLGQSALYSLALGAGLTPARAKIAAAIGMAESGGNPNAHNTTPPDDSYGIWQINLYGNLASRVKTFGLSAPSDLLNPKTNAKAMARLSANGSNFGAWSTFKDGSYQHYLGNPVQDVSKDQGFLSNIAGGAVSAITAPFQEAASAAAATEDAVKVLGKTAVWVSNPSNWVRVGYVIGGAAILIVGIATIVGGTKAGKTAATAGLGVATDGASLAAGAAKKAVTPKSGA